MNVDLTGRVALVTGAASGIGRAIADAFGRAGAAVTIADLREKDAGRAAAELADAGVETLAVAGDVSSREDARAYVERTVKRFGRLDVLVNNAGLQHVASVEDFDEERWDYLIGVMLTGTFLCSKYAVPYLRRSDRGRIVNVSSIHGQVASPYKSAYVSAKHGIIGFTRTLALELAEDSVTCNAVCPGYVRTPLVEAQVADQARVRGIGEEQVVEEVMLAPGGVKRLLEPEEVAALCLYLVSEDARMVTGAALSIDGGWTAR